MPVAAEIEQVLPGCYTWQAFSSRAKVELTSHALQSGDELFLVDPIRLTNAGLKQLEELDGRIAGVLLTNGNHERDAAFYRDRYGVPIYGDPAAKTELTVSIEDLPRYLGALEIIPLPGAGAGEVGIYALDKKILCLGDIIINLDSFAFAPLPDKYATNPRQMRESILKLAALDVNTICFAHGFPVASQAVNRIRTLALTFGVSG